MEEDRLRFRPEFNGRSLRLSVNHCAAETEPFLESVIGHPQVLPIPVYIPS